MFWLELARLTLLGNKEAIAFLQRDPMSVTLLASDIFARYTKNDFQAR